MGQYRWEDWRGPGASIARPSADDGLRVSDAERQEVADQLTKHYADGRLDQAEFGERLEQAMGAKTWGDLDGLFYDLPGQAVSAAAPPIVRRRHRFGIVVLVVALLVFTLPRIWLFPFSPFPGFFRVPWLLLGLVALVAYRRGHRRRVVDEP